jgi:glycolate oxidase iron-sulfur subunit
MQTFITEALKQTPQVIEADRILRSCVHCGFCTATCPTYRITGDELDSPRGRIYLIKSVLEGKPSGYRTQNHIDRCLTCRACETTCPSGVEYGKLLDIGKELIEEKVGRPWYECLIRYLLRKCLINPKRFTLLLRIGQVLKPILPSFLGRRIPVRPIIPVNMTGTDHPRKVLLFIGCVQPALAPGINLATVRILDKIGITALSAEGEVCCGAISHHMTATEEAKKFIRKNIDSWWPYVEKGIEAIVINASGCGVMIKEYGTLLRDDPDYAEKANTISVMARDIAEMFSENDLDRLKNTMNPVTEKMAFHSPCSLQHGQKLAGITEALLAKLGLNQVLVPNTHICCGSAGVYSILQNDMATKLQMSKIEALTAGDPEVIATANIGCQVHLQQSTNIPVRHWIEIVDEMIV